MMTTTRIAAAMAALAGAGTALGQFGVRSVDTGSLGSPITASANFWQSSAPGADPRPPSPELIDSSDPNDSAEFDSYVAIDCGPSTGGDPDTKGDGFHANPGDLDHLGNPFGPNTLNGVWFTNPSGARPTVPSCANPLFGGQQAIFIARLSFRSLDGSLPSETISLGTNGVVVDVVDSATGGAGPGSTDSLLVRFSSFNASIQTGLDGADLQSYPMAFPYQLRSVEWSAGPLPGGTARWSGYDLYVVQIPAPGGAAGLLGAGVLGLRRRR